ncbi:inorganic diphosphatase [Nodosilinea sp. PGN35]|uniref:inorganic diphosphatase n=1 Tax=Nodosilinea sp. PGN35 TaxID=3020489 RepID=UPI0023B2F4CD|nr:inorganic diphosphatase [Nodosilinea sp. TSF1-S3]MDF0369777.1 inorganic diphosphatase [Nodosilinea sp. TSF1-S3]
MVVCDIGDMPAMELERMEEFFAVYKRLPQSSDVIELRGFGDAREAQAMVRRCVRRSTATGRSRGWFGRSHPPGRVLAGGGDRP